MRISHRLVPELAAPGHDVDTVRSERLTGRRDNEVWQAAQLVDRFLITQDLDFSDVPDTRPGHSGDCYWCVSYGLVGMPWSHGLASLFATSLSSSGRAAWS